MKEVLKLICTSCPQGCALEVTVEGKNVLKVEGEGCLRACFCLFVGKTYKKTYSELPPT